MKLVLGRLPKLDDCLYITNRYKHNHKACISIPSEYAHLLFQALQHDGLITAGDIHELERSLEDWDRVTFDLLEMISIRHEWLFNHLRRWFTSTVENDEEKVFVPIVPGFPNVSLLQCFSFKKKSCYVLDIRDANVNFGLLKSVINLLDDVYIVSDDIVLNPDIIIVSEHVNTITLRSIYHEPYKLANKVLKLEDGRYKVTEDDVVEFLDECFTIPTCSERCKRVDILDVVFRTKSRDYSGEIEEMLCELWESCLAEANLRDRLMERLDGDYYMARVALHLLLHYNLITYTVTPAGRVYMISTKAMRLLLDRAKARREAREGEEEREGNT